MKYAKGMSARRASVLSLSGMRFARVGRYNERLRSTRGFARLAALCLVLGVLASMLGTQAGFSGRPVVDPLGVGTIRAPSGRNLVLEEFDGTDFVSCNPATGICDFVGTGGGGLLNNHAVNLPYINLISVADSYCQGGSDGNFSSVRGYNLPTTPDALCDFGFILPMDFYEAGDALTVQLVYMSFGGAGPGTAVLTWGLSCYADSQADSGTEGTATQVLTIDASEANGDINYAALQPLTGSAYNANEFCALRLTRTTTHASDTWAGGVLVIAIRLFTTVIK